MAQRDLFDKGEGSYYDLYDGSPPSSDDGTSKEAAESIRSHVSRLAKEVMLFIESRKGATCYEVEQGTGMSHQTASARIRELALKGRIRKSGTTRPTGSGRQAAVWVKQ